MDMWKILALSCVVVAGAEGSGQLRQLNEQENTPITPVASEESIVSRGREKSGSGGSSKIVVSTDTGINEVESPGKSTGGPGDGVPPGEKDPAVLLLSLCASFNCNARSGANEKASATLRELIASIVKSLRSLGEEDVQDLLVDPASAALRETLLHVSPIWGGRAALAEEDRTFLEGLIKQMYPDAVSVAEGAGRLEEDFKEERRSTLSAAAVALSHVLVYGDSYGTLPEYVRQLTMFGAQPLAAALKDPQLTEVQRALLLLKEHGKEDVLWKDDVLCAALRTAFPEATTRVDMIKALEGELRKNAGY